MEVVTTKKGKMRIAGAVRKLLGGLYDTYLSFIFVFILVKLAGVEAEGDPFIAAILMVVILIFPLLVQLELIPGLGRWTLGLHKFKYDDIEEYSGEGTLVVSEILESDEYIFRAVLAGCVMGISYTFLKYLMGS